MRKQLAYDLNILMRNPGFAFSIIMAICIAIAGWVEALLRNSEMGFSVGYAAPSMAMIFRSGVGQIAFICLIPFLVAFPYGDSYFMECNIQIASASITRRTRTQYFFSKYLVISATSFFLAVLPFLFNLLLCCISFPLKGLEVGQGDGIYGILWNTMFVNAQFPLLHMNAPILNDLAHIAMTGCYGMCIAEIGYCITLYYRRNRLTAVGLAGIISIILFVLLQSVSRNYVLAYYLPANDDMSELSFSIFAILILLITLFTMLAVWVKTKWQKDIL